MKVLDIPQDLQEKMRRRAERAFANFDAGINEHTTRCSEVARESLRYRISHKIAGTSGHYSGPRVVIQRIFKKRWYNPLSWLSQPEIIVPAKVGDDEHIIDHAKEPKALTTQETVPSGHQTITMLPPPDADHQWSEKTNTLPDVDGSDADLTHIESA